MTSAANVDNILNSTFVNYVKSNYYLYSSMYHFGMHNNCKSQEIFKRVAQKIIEKNEYCGRKNRYIIWYALYM